MKILCSIRRKFDSFICAKSPAGRWLNTEESVGSAVFLVSSASDAINGYSLYVGDGIQDYCSGTKYEEDCKSPQEKRYAIFIKNY